MRNGPSGSEKITVVQKFMRYSQDICEDIKISGQMLLYVHVHIWHVKKQSEVRYCFIYNLTWKCQMY